MFHSVVINFIYTIPRDQVARMINSNELKGEGMSECENAMTLDYKRDVCLMIYG